MIAENVRKLLEEIPEGIEVIAAAKTRTAAEVSEAIAAGIKIIGENYVQEALRVHEQVAERARWHFIGHLQTNKVKKVAGIFDMVQTVDSLRLAREIDKRCYAIGKVMPGEKALTYNGFGFSIHDPLGRHVYWASNPVEIRIELAPLSPVVAPGR